MYNLLLRHVKRVIERWKVNLAKPCHVALLEIVKLSCFGVPKEFLKIINSLAVHEQLLLFYDFQCSKADRYPCHSFMAKCIDSNHVTKTLHIQFEQHQQK